MRTRDKGTELGPAIYGVPVEAAGSVLGGVGISGASGSEADDACARQGIKAVLEKLSF